MLEISFLIFFPSQKKTLTQCAFIRYCIVVSIWKLYVAYVIFILNLLFQSNKSLSNAINFEFCFRYFHRIVFYVFLFYLKIVMSFGICLIVSKIQIFTQTTIANYYMHSIYSIST